MGFSQSRRHASTSAFRHVIPTAVNSLQCSTWSPSHLGFIQSCSPASPSALRCVVPMAVSSLPSAVSFTAVFSTKGLQRLAWTSSGLISVEQPSSASTWSGLRRSLASVLQVHLAIFTPTSAGLHRSLRPRPALTSPPQPQVVVIAGFDCECSFAAPLIEVAPTPCSSELQAGDPRPSSSASRHRDSINVNPSSTPFTIQTPSNQTGPPSPC